MSCILFAVTIFLALGELCGGASMRGHEIVELYGGVSYPPVGLRLSGMPVIDLTPVLLPWTIATMRDNWPLYRYKYSQGPFHLVPGRRQPSFPPHNFGTYGTRNSVQKEIGKPHRLMTQAMFSTLQAYPIVRLGQDLAYYLTPPPPPADMIA